MKNIKDILEEFDEKYMKYMPTSTAYDVKDFIKQNLKEFIGWEIKRLENKILDKEDEKDFLVGYLIGYNNAIDGQIKHYQELLKEL